MVMFKEIGKIIKREPAKYIQLQGHFINYAKVPF